MTSEPRAALDRLIAALEAHLAAAGRRQGEADPAVVSAYQTLADAFEAYDEALYDAYDEVTPFVLYDDAEDAEDEDDEDLLDDDEGLLDDEEDLALNLGDDEDEDDDERVGEQGRDPGGEQGGDRDGRNGADVVDGLAVQNESSRTP